MAGARVEEQPTTTTQTKTKMYAAARAPGYGNRTMRDMNTLAGQLELTSSDSMNGLPGLKHTTGKFLSTYSRNMRENDQKHWMKH